MNLEQIIDRARQLAHVRSPALAPDDQLVEQANEYTRYLFDTYDWPQARQVATVELEEGVARYPLPAGAVRVFGVRTAGSNPNVLAELTPGEGRARRGSGGLSAFWVDWATSELVLVPAPSAAGELEVTVKVDPPAMVGMSDVPPMPEKFHMAWCYAVAVAVLTERGASPVLAGTYGTRLANLERRMREQFLFGSSRVTRLGVKWR